MKSLKQILEDASDGQRASIFRLWNITDETAGKTKQQQINLLEKRVRNPIAARFVWEYLTEDERQILYRVVPPATRNSITEDSGFIKKTQLTAERFTAAVQTLVEKALLDTREEPARSNMYVVTTSKKATKPEKVTILTAISENAEILYEASREYFTPSGDRSKWDLDRLLTTLSYNDLDKALSHYGIPYKKPSSYYGTHDTLLITDKLIDMEEPLDHLSDFDATARKLFVWLREHGGKESIASARTFLKVDDEILLQTLNILARHALVFDSFSKQERVLFVPSEWYSNMKSLSADIKLNEGEGKLLEFEGNPAAALPGENTTGYDLAMMINTLYQQTIEPTQAGRVPKRIANKVRTTLRGKVRPDYNDDDDYIEMLLDVLEYYQIVQLTHPTFQDIKPAYEVTPTIEQWAKKTLLEQTVHLLAYWLENFQWIDVYGVNYTSWTSYSWDFAGGRKALLKHLRNCTPGRWYTIDSLLQEIWKDDAFAYRPGPSYKGAKKQVKDYDTHVKWERCEGEVYRGILSSTLYEFGMVDVGYADANALSSKKAINPDYFTLTELGGKILELVSTQGKSYVAEEQDTTTRGLVVQPNFELLLLQPDTPTLYALLPFAQAKQLGLVSTLTLTKASVTRGLNAGKNIEQILQTLQERSQNDIPQNVDYTLRDWTKTYKSVKLSQVLLFEVSSEDAGKLLSVIPSLENMGVRQVAPCIFTASGDVNLQALRKELEKVGVFVRISGDIFTRPKHFYDPYFATYGRY